VLPYWQAFASRSANLSRYAVVLDAVVEAVGTIDSDPRTTVTPSLSGGNPAAGVGVLPDGGAVSLGSPLVCVGEPHAASVKFVRIENIRRRQQRRHAVDRQER
jgi:hypothetical protein